MKLYKLGLGCVLIASVMSQTRVDLRTQAKSVDFSGASSTKPSQTGTILPTTCSLAQTFFLTTAPAGQNIYACTAVNVWTLEGGSGSGGGGAISSVFGRTGAVTAQSGDYSTAQISGLASSATTDTTNASNITSGTLGAARLPTPGAATLGGVQSKDCSAGGQFLQKVNIDGTETCGTPAGGGNVSGPGTVTNGYLPLWGASNNLLTAGLAVSSVAAPNTVAEAGVGGTLAAGWLPSAGSHTVNTTAPLSGGGAVALGGTLTLACPTCLTANAVPSVFGRTGAVTAQSGDYLAAQISGLAASATTDTTNATNITSGTLGAARLPTPGPAALGGVQAINCSSGGQFLQAINTNGTETCATPAGGGNVSGPGTVTSGYLATWGASNNLLTTGLAVSTASAANAVPEAGVGGTLAAAGWLPSAGSHTVNTTAPLSGGGAVALGGALTLSCPACLTANAVPSVFGRTGAVTALSGDYSAAQISGLASSATTDTTNAANILSGTLNHARLPALVSADIPSNAANTTGNAATANALAGTPLLCPTGQAPTGILANGNATACAAIGGGGGGGVADPGANGIMVRNALNTTAPVTITAGSGITVANGNGVAGNPLIGLDTTVAVTQAQAQTFAPLIFAGTLAGNIYNGALNPPPGGFVDGNGNPLVMLFCPATSWPGGAVNLNNGLGAKRLLIDGNDPPGGALVASSCYLTVYNSSMTVDGIASVGAFELKSPSSINPSAPAYDMTKFTAYYTMQEGSGTTLVDHSGHANNATQVGTVTWIADGGNSFANAYTNYWSLPLAITAGSNLRTLLLAVQMTYNGSNNCAYSNPLGPISAVTGTGVLIGYDYNTMPTCDLTFDLFNASTSQTRFSETPGYGIHVIGFNLDTSVAANNNIYIDGVKGTSPLLQVAAITSAAQLALGAWPGGNTGFPGTIYSAAFGTTALTDQQMMDASQTMRSNLAQRGVNLNPINTDTASYLTFVGDSLTLGLYGGGTSIPGSVSTTQTFTKLNLGLTGQSLQQMLAKLPGVISRQSQGAYNAVVLWGGTNDLCAYGATLAQTEQRYAAAGKLLRAARIPTVIGTVISRITCDANRDALNTWIRANWPQFADALADVAADSHLGPDGSYSNTTYYNGDGIHLTATGYATAAPYFSAAVNSLTNALVPSVGTTIVSASTIAPVNFMQHLTGTAAINTITPPPNFAMTGQGGCLTLVADGAWALGTSGNITTAFTAAVGSSYWLCYDNGTAKWYPPQPSSVGGMVYPGGGLTVSTGTGWGTSLVAGGVGHVPKSNGTSYVDAALTVNQSCPMWFGDSSSATPLTNSQLGPQVGMCFIPSGATVLEIDVRANAGTPSIVIGVDTAGSVTPLLSSALSTAASGGRACAKVTAVAGMDGTTCSATLQNTAIAAGGYIQAVTGTAGGTATWMTANVVYSVPVN